MEVKITAEIFLLIVVFVQRSVGQNYTFVTTENGIIRGNVRHLNLSDELTDQQVGIFLGIPYAKPPIGDLRFLKPQPPDPLDGTLEADEMPPACIQYSQYPFPWYDSLPGKSEDCLYLNVWAPVNINRKKRPVKFYIHGGGFSAGSNRIGYYDGLYEAVDNFVEYPDLFKDYPGYYAYVVVAINYRLGALGFLTTGTEDAPGNVGLFDMVMALNWVRTNIEAFNGDPDNVVLAGQEAGAIAASLFCTSSLASILFNRVILSGGTFLSIRENKYEGNLALSKRLAEAVSCNAANPKEMVDCLRSKDADLLAEVLSSFDPTSSFQFYPQYEKDDLFPFDPVMTLSDGIVKDIDVLLINTSEEGSSLLTTSQPDEFGVFGEKDVGVNETFAKSALTKYLKEYPDPAALAEKLLTGMDTGTTDANRRKLFEAMGDVRVVCPSLYFAEYYMMETRYSSRTVNVYIIQNTLSPPYNPWAAWMGTESFSNVQNEVFKSEGPLVVNGVSYPSSEIFRSYSFFTKFDHAFFLYTGETSYAKFSISNPQYTYEDGSQYFPGRGKSTPFPGIVKSNLSDLNCNVLRSYL